MPAWFQLEQQVSDLKRRLDELRKAKSTTIIKKDKEYVATGVPRGLHNTPSVGSTDLPECRKQEASSVEIQLEKSIQRSNQEVKELQANITAMKELHRAELEELKKEVEKQVP